MAQAAIATNIIEKLSKDSVYYRILANWCNQFELVTDQTFREIEASCKNNESKYFKLLSPFQKQNAPNEPIAYIEPINTFLNNLFLLNEEKLTENIENVTPESPHLKVTTIKTTKVICKAKSSVPVYSMQSKNRGVLFFVNIRYFPHTNNDRHGSEHDKLYMISLFRAFGFKIYYYEDLMKSTFFHLVDKLIKHHLDNTDSLMFIVTTHGSANGKMEFYYGEQITINTILAKFNDIECPSMKGKPKVFVFPCCRGNEIDYGTHPFQTEGELIKKPDDVKVTPSFQSDMLICYGTVDGFKTFRDYHKGNWFIGQFYKVLAEEAYINDIETMLCKINTNIVKYYAKLHEEYPHIKPVFQTPAVAYRDFNKHLYFNPGYVHEEESCS